VASVVNVPVASSLWEVVVVEDPLAAITVSLADALEFDCVLSLVSVGFPGVFAAVVKWVLEGAACESH